MEDMGDAMSGTDDVMMLGGGNPAHIPEVQLLFKERMQSVLDKPSEFNRLIGNYDSPKGEKRFIDALVAFFNNNYGWGVKASNIALTSGSQTAFFMLFNTFAGTGSDGIKRKILLPMVPEYIGYADVGIEDDLFRSERPEINIIDEHLFKYSLDKPSINVGNDVGAVCVSRPTNPSGNVLTDDEIDYLLSLASANDVPLIIDNAYGAPFPNIIFTESSISWSEQIIFSMSLSKLGLPSVRTGIIIAREDVIEKISYMNSVVNLALGNLGPNLVFDLVKSNHIIDLCKRSIQPFYKSKMHQALSLVHKELQGLEYYVHQPEGAIFLWLWLPGLPITSQELYERLKKRGVLILSGHHFFPGLKKGPWQHQHECIRISYAMDDTLVINGIKLIAEEIRSIYNQ
jgi:valine--pyruvate aminotransferase